MIRNLFLLVFGAALSWVAYLAYSNRSTAAVPAGTDKTAVPQGQRLMDPRNTAKLMKEAVDQVTATGTRAASRAVPARAPVATNYRGTVHYSPTENLEAIDIATISASRCDHLDIAAYAYTDRAIAQAVVAFANSGRRIHIYRDHEQYTQEASRGSYVAHLFAGNKNISVRVKSSHTLMHIKAFSDGCVMREGSANWSPSGEKEQDNTLTLTSDPTAIRDFETTFAAMWNRRDNLIVQ